MPGLAQPRHDVEQALDLAGLSEAVGSSKMMSFGLERERLGDLDELALGRGEPADLPVERQGVLLAEAREDLRRRAGACAP